jgi:hypothetical protein
MLAYAHSRARAMRFINEFLRRIGNDPVKYALRVVFALGILLLLLLLLMPKAGAQPLFVANLESGQVTLTDEACVLKAVTNAPKRVTWREPNGRVSEGCYGLYTLRLTNGNVDIIVSYFDDLTLQIIPLAVFSVVRAI